jgi:hypothetical protein
MVSQRYVPSCYWMPDIVNELAPATHSALDRVERSSRPYESLFSQLDFHRPIVKLDSIAASKACGRGFRNLKALTASLI